MPHERVRSAYRIAAGAPVPGGDGVFGVGNPQAVEVKLRE